MEVAMGHHIAEKAIFKWIEPNGVGDLHHLSVDGNYVGSIAPDTKNPSSRHPWSWRVTIPDSVDRKTPLAGHAMDEQSAKTAAEQAFSRAMQEKS
jgi:hypothetical protein